MRAAIQNTESMCVAPQRGAAVLRAAMRLAMSWMQASEAATLVSRERRRRSTSSNLAATCKDACQVWLSASRGAMQGTWGL